MKATCAMVATLLLIASAMAAPIDPNVVRNAHAWGVINRGDAANLTFNDSDAPTSWDTATPTPSGDSKSVVLVSSGTQTLKWRENQNLPNVGEGMTAYLVWKPGSGLIAGTAGDTDNYTVMEFRAAGFRINVMGHSVDGTTYLSIRDKQGAKPWFANNYAMGGAYGVPTSEWMYMWLQVDAAGNFRAYDVTSGTAVVFGTGVATGGSSNQFTFGDESSGTPKDTDLAIDEVYVNSFIDVSAIPEPSTLCLLAGGLVLLCRRRG